MEPRPPISSQLKPRKLHQHHHASLTKSSQEHQAQDVSTSQVVLTDSECSANECSMISLVAGSHLTDGSVHCQVGANC